MTDLVPRRAAPALLGYAAIRLLGVSTLVLWGTLAGSSAHTLLARRWDSLWYTRVAESGYGYAVVLPNGDVHSNLAFFPLLPWSERALAALTPLSHADAGLAVAWAASLAAAWGIFAVGDHLYGRRAATLLVLLWAALPVGVVQSMAYSESLFTALAAWSLHASLTGRWVTAGALAACAGLTRPVGAAVVAAVWVAAWQAQRISANPRRPRAALVTGVLLAPLGAAGYVLWVGWHTGAGPLGYLRVQAGWGNGFDFGLAFAGFIGDKLTSSAFPAGIALLVGVLLVLWLYRLAVRQGQPAPLLLYTAVVVLLALCSAAYFGSKPRLLMPAFPLLLPVALALARWRVRRTLAVLAPLVAGSAAYGAFWLNGSGPP
ncbi:hypothetical protein [Streptomyces sp. NPDC006879]|uniref:hypothetical protein n=1 Tax=Streptomyces sp. NPDC006879 TaxID=3364767 RepID=UPI0036C771F3